MAPYLTHSLMPANFRDVGEMLSIWFDPSPLLPGLLYRGGKLGPIMGPTLAAPVRTVVNLRASPDAPMVDVCMAHHPAPRGIDRYDTHLRPVRAWVADVMARLTDPAMEWPIYLHCASGRDRTGVIVAAALLCIGIDREIVEQEYLLSDDADLASMRRAVDGLLGFEGWRPKRLMGPLADAAATLRRRSTR